MSFRGSPVNLVNPFGYMARKGQPEPAIPVNTLLKGEFIPQFANGGVLHAYQKTREMKTPPKTIFQSSCEFFQQKAKRLFRKCLARTLFKLLNDGSGVFCLAEYYELREGRTAS